MNTPSKFNNNLNSNETNENSYINQTLPSINNNNHTNRNTSRNLNESLSQESESFDKVFLTSRKKKKSKK